MASRRETQVSETIAHLAGDFFAREGGVKALMTVTYAHLSPDFKTATVYFSVLPQTHEAEALAFAKRARSDFREYIKGHALLHPIPFVDFAIDIGEKNRQRVDELTRKKP
jgi:ribosome-binding factor A